MKMSLLNHPIGLAVSLKVHTASNLPAATHYVSLASTIPTKSHHAIAKAQLPSCM
jgi:hypothetical protein